MAVRGSDNAAGPARGAHDHTDGEFSLDDKYAQERGASSSSGIQALVRLPLDQLRADPAGASRRRRSSRATAARRSAGSTQRCERTAKLLLQHHVVFSSRPERGARRHRGVGHARWLHARPQPKYDGVARHLVRQGAGRRPRRRRAAHANYAGIGRNGGVVAVVGDDPAAKSSTLPSHSEARCSDALHARRSTRATCRRSSTSACTASRCRALSGLWVGAQDRHQRRRRRGHRRGVARSGVEPRSCRSSTLDGKPFRHQTST